MVSVEPVDALLAIDVGNTRIGVGVWDSDGLHDARRCALDNAEVWQTALAQTWSEIGATKRAVVIGSVNPDDSHRVRAHVEQLSGLSAFTVREDIPLPMPVEIDNLDEVGVDRICSAAAAYERVQTACAVASFGTAMTVDCVSADGSFLGGAILPGLQMGCNALHDATAQLPRVEPQVPRTVFAKNTHDAIVNGVAYGAVGALREIVERYATDLQEWPQLVITGGNAPLVAELVDFVDAIVPDLCLMGVALAYRRASGQP
jgi:type III pantothenate kinase